MNKIVVVSSVVCVFVCNSGRTQIEMAEKRKVLVLRNRK
jgi:hypothetical protein